MGKGREAWYINSQGEQHNYNYRSRVPVGGVMAIAQLDIANELTPSPRDLSLRSEANYKSLHVNTRIDTFATSTKNMYVLHRRYIA